VILRASVRVLDSQTRLLASSEKVLLRVLVGVVVIALVILEVTEGADHVGLVVGWWTVGWCVVVCGSGCRRQGWSGVFV
jgi:hypothetical protein